MGNTEKLINRLRELDAALASKQAQVAEFHASLCGEGPEAKAQRTMLHVLEAELLALHKRLLQLEGFLGKFWAVGAGWSSPGRNCVSVLPVSCSRETLPGISLVRVREHMRASCTVCLYYNKPVDAGLEFDDQDGELQWRCRTSCMACPGGLGLPCSLRCFPSRFMYFAKTLFCANTRKTVRAFTTHVHASWHCCTYRILFTFTICSSPCQAASTSGHCTF